MLSIAIFVSIALVESKGIGIHSMVIIGHPNEVYLRGFREEMLHQYFLSYFENIYLVIDLTNSIS